MCDINMRRVRRVMSKDFLTVHPDLAPVPAVHRVVREEVTQHVGRGEVVDGRHRCLKLLDRGETEIRAIFLTAEDMEAAMIKRRVKKHRFSFALHNLIGHPVMEVLHWFGRDDWGDKVHAWTLPREWEEV